jgi:hypothetical protein
MKQAAAFLNRPRRREAADHTELAPTRFKSLFRD